MVQTSQFQKQERNFLKEVLNTEVLSFGAICHKKLSIYNMIIVNSLYIRILCEYFEGTTLMKISRTLMWLVS